MTRFRRKKKIWMSCALAKARTRMPGRLVIATPANTYTEKIRLPVIYLDIEMGADFFLLLKILQWHWVHFTVGYLLRCPFWPWPPSLFLRARAERSVQMIWSYGTQTQQRCPQPADSIGKSTKKAKLGSSQFLSKVKTHFNRFQHTKGRICRSP